VNTASILQGVGTAIFPQMNLLHGLINFY